MLSGLLITLIILVCLALIGVVLLQRSEGGAFGMGGGPTGLITARGAGDLLTRTTWVLFSLFLALALSLTLLGAHDRGSSSLVKGLNGQKVNPMALPQTPAAPSAPLPGAPVAGGQQAPGAPFLSGPAVQPAAPPAMVPAPTAPPAKAAVAKPAKGAPARAARGAPTPVLNAPALAPIDVAPVAPTKSEAAPAPAPAAPPPSAPAPKPDPNAPVSTGSPQQ